MGIKKNFIYNSFLIVPNYVVNLILFPYCARVLGVEKFGTISFVQNVVQFFLFIAMMGITTIGIREVAKQTNKADLEKCYSSMFFLNLLYTLVSIVLYIPLIFLIDKFYAHKELYILGVFQILFNTFCIEWFFRGTENFKYITIRNVVVKTLYVLLVFALVRSDEHYAVYYLLTVLVTVVNAIINFCYARKFVRFAWKRISITRYVSGSFSLGGYAILTSMYTTFNVAYLGFLWDDAQVGLYTTAIKLYTIILGFYSAFTSVMLPRMSALLSKGDDDSFNRLINKSFELLYTIALPMVIILIILSPEIILLLAGAKYEQAVTLSRIVVPMLFVVGVAQILSFQVLIPKGYDKTTLYASILGAIVGTSGNVWLTRYYAAVGTCITVAVTEICVTMYYLYISVRRHLIHIDYTLILKHFFAAIPYIFICFTAHYCFSSSLSLCLIIALFLCAIYFYISQVYWLKNSIVKSILGKV